MLAIVAQRLTQRIVARRPLDPALLIAPEPRRSHAVVVGYGRVGGLVCDMLDRHGIPHTAVDHDPGTVTAFRKAGRNVYFGDAASPAFLKACGVMEASAVIVTIHTHAKIDDIVGVVRKLRSDILIVSRARDADHARHLYSIGVTDAVPETIEASLQLSEAALVGLGVPTGPVIASIHEKRDEFRHALQEAARTVGLEQSRAFRPKTTA
jgi:CPA2 family monovalent cation:H+ antiporter-2